MNAAVATATEERGIANADDEDDDAAADIDMKCLLPASVPDERRMRR